MPRDPEQEERPAPLLTESPNSVDQQPSMEMEQRRDFVMIPKSQQSKGPSNLHPYMRPLTISDLDSCVALENAAFPVEQERCTREKFIYRLSRCGELSLGLFCTFIPDSGVEAETFATGRPVETSRKDGATSVLLAHIVSTKATTPVVTDKAMDYPQDWNFENPSPSFTGHQEAGRTICLHSVGVLPGFQGRGLGRIIIIAYMQQMNGAGIADRLALIAHNHLVPYYEKLGFTNKGHSKAQFGGGGWNDMVFDLKAPEARATYG